MDGGAALRLRGITKRYGARVVLRSLDLDIAPGETVAVLGPNGAGKSTLLRIAAGLARPDAGSVEVAGHDVRKDPLATRKACSFLSQDAPLYDELTPAEHIAWWSRLHDGPASQATTDQALVEAGLARLAHHPVRTLSRGERQRLALTLALLPDPALLILDEPFTALDTVAHAWLESLLVARRDRGATLLSLHDEAAAARVASRVVRLGAAPLAVAPGGRA
ncbi:MAG: heme ABC exporter ATP-binding protein CcmA [Thermoplasmatota archaeon]